MKDSLTSLYNHFFGKELINEYLKEKDPYATCGMMVLDVDYFKQANDRYGHLFGDQVLVELAGLLVSMFDAKDIVMRAGGDEFVVFLKDISHSALVKKGMKLVEAVRELRFAEREYSITCSVGICFLGENISGYTYDQLLKMRTGALYRAKENGRTVMYSVTICTALSSWRETAFRMEISISVICIMISSQRRLRFLRR